MEDPSVLQFQLSTEQICGVFVLLSLRLQGSSTITRKLTSLTKICGKRNSESSFLIFGALQLEQELVQFLRFTGKRQVDFLEKLASAVQRCFDDAPRKSVILLQRTQLGTKSKVIFGFSGSSIKIKFKKRKRKEKRNRKSISLSRERRA